MTSTITSAPVPLTTTFTPPADCFTDSYHMQWLSGTNYYTPVSATYTWWWISLGASDWSTCFPSAFATATTSYFSPGLCPSGYTAGGLSEVSLDSNVETRATCCPSGYNAQTGDGWPWYSSNPCTSSNTNSDSVYVYTFDGTVSSQTGTFGIQGKGVSIRWQSTDFVSATSTSDSLTFMTSTSTSTLKRDATATGTSEAVSDTTKTSATSGLSTGAKAGIGIGCAVGAILLIIAALVFFRRRKPKFMPSELDQNTMRHSHQAPVEMDTGSAELMDAHGNPVELESHCVSARVELDATNYQKGYI
ncbi:hypothetical protein N7454_004924 [Penicillium verhagenii]|nr:hypothetical protein N7454_004924 [Penicillium verhagenii]